MDQKSIQKWLDESVSSNIEGEPPSDEGAVRPPSNLVVNRQPSMESEADNTWPSISDPVFDVNASVDVDDAAVGWEVCSTGKPTTPFPGATAEKLRTFDPMEKKSKQTVLINSYDPNCIYIEGKWEPNGPKGRARDKRLQEIQRASQPRPEPIPRPIQESVRPPFRGPLRKPPYSFTSNLNPDAAPFVPRNRQPAQKRDEGR